MATIGTSTEGAKAGRGVAAAGGWRWTWPFALYAALLALHAPLLNLPYFWDEAGYFVFAALDCFQHGWLVPHSTLANGHPPLLSLYLAGAWRLAGFHPSVTRAAMLVWAAALICGAYRLARPRLGRAAWIPALLLALTPLVFAQATLAQLDLPVAALVVWALAEETHLWRCALLLSAACLMKETAVIVPLALLAVAGVRGWRARRRGQQATWEWLSLLVPVAVLGLWFVYYHHRTGYWFGNPQYFAYNVAQDARSLPRIGLALLRRGWQLVGYDGTWLLTLLALLALVRVRRHGAKLGAPPSAAPPPTARAAMPASWLTVVAAYVIFHAVVGGAVLARYLLPALALYYIWLGGMLARLPRAGWWVAGCAGFLVTGWFWNPPYPFPYEDNLAYVSYVKLHQAAAQQLERQGSAAPIVTAWPATDELTRPALGYVTRPLPVQALEDFTPASMAGIHPPVERLYLFSRIYQPRRDIARLPLWARWARRYFRYTPPADAGVWLARFHLRPEFERHRAGQWVMVAGPSGP